MEKIINAEDLPEKEKVYLKKSFGEWKVVHPIRNEDGTINWFNLITGGSWITFFSTLVFIVILILAMLEYKSNMDMCNRIIEQGKMMILIK